VLIGVASSGVHSNGYSLVRKVLELTGLRLDSEAPFARGMPVGEALLTPTRLYVKAALAAIKRGGVKGLAHITGGGITGNLPRAQPPDLDADVDLGAWKLPPVFQWLAREAALPEAEMLRTFNCGIGLIVVADAAKAADVAMAFRDYGEQAFPIGALVTSSGPEPDVRYRGRLLP
jgi:phosphoribosylformylglycinamidine cyclo-ligase